ncbi:MAG TPA: UDP-2,3-diacylglucosamine diphosphatase [Kiloniellales bacterium]|nr:UDP-2,3-diacylglucosamine diphosphatase [Kiloniellales bacterium]
MNRRFHRTIFISDLHLGSRLCKAENLLDFLTHNEARTLYLVGDVFDIKRLRRRWYWPSEHRAVVRQILAKARAGTRVVYVPGNHDPDLRDRLGVRRNGIEVAHEVMHETADGRRLLVVHGDEYEPCLNRGDWVYRCGCLLYLSGVRASEIVGGLRRRVGLGYWSFSAFLKDRLLEHVPIARAFKENLAAEARRRGADGVVCGHIHHARAERIDGVTYYNDGDWVESCTALVEDADGRLELLRWSGWRGRAAPAPVFVPAGGPLIERPAVAQKAG